MKRCWFTKDQNAVRELLYYRMVISELNTPDRLLRVIIGRIIRLKRIIRTTPNILPKVELISRFCLQGFIVDTELQARCRAEHISLTTTISTGQPCKIYRI